MTSYIYKPITWDYVNNYIDDRGAMYKVQMVTERTVITRRFILPQLENDYNIQVWIRERNNETHTTELGIEQVNHIVKTFTYCSDTWHKDRYLNNFYVRSPTARPEDISVNRITRNRILYPDSEIGILQVEILPGKVKGFLNEKFFGEISCNTENLFITKYGIEAYYQSTPFEFISHEIKRLA